jgi:N-acetylmuramoyl-L-alanine amidase
MAYDIAISSGHGLKIRGASGVLDEVNEARRVVSRVASLLSNAGVKCVQFNDDTSTTQSANLAAIVNFHNAQKRDRDISVHFNAFQATDSPRGTECLHLTQPTLAAQIASLTASAGHFINRGGKKRTDLYFLNKTAKPAVLIEVCFVDSTTDARLYNEHFEAICKAIAETIADVRLSGTAPVPPPELSEVESLKATLREIRALADEAL